MYQDFLDKINQMIDLSSLIELFIITNLILILFQAINKTSENKNKSTTTPIKWIFWNIGALGTYILLDYLDVLEPTHQSFVLLGFTWNKVFNSLKNKFDSDGEKGEMIEKIKNMINE